MQLEQGGRLRTRSRCTIGLLAALLTMSPAASVPAQEIGGARTGFVPERQISADTTPSRAVSGLPAGVTGGIIGTLLGAATGAFLSYAAHHTYCGETSSCDDYPDRSLRDATLVGAGIGFLLGVGIEGLIVDKRERDRARIRADEAAEASNLSYVAPDGRCMRQVRSLASVCLTFSIPVPRTSTTR